MDSHYNRDCVCSCLSVTSKCSLFTWTLTLGLTLGVTPRMVINTLPAQPWPQPRKATENRAGGVPALSRRGGARAGGAVCPLGWSGLAHRAVAACGQPLNPPQSGRPGTWLPSGATKARDLCAAVLCPGGVDGRALHFSELSWAKDGVIQGYEPLQGMCVSSAHRAPL